MIEKTCEPRSGERHEVVFLGSAGQRILTAGEILCYAGLAAGLHVTQKSEYNITVLTGPSITEVILSPGEIGYTGIQKPGVILALAEEGVTRRKGLFGTLDQGTLILKAAGVELPPQGLWCRRWTLRARRSRAAIGPCPALP
jgi:2-oxoglutarate/2-oxoacid ferredoxin oxidoreductase subunit beta